MPKIYLAIHIIILEASPTGMAAIVVGEPSASGFEQLPAFLGWLLPDGFGSEIEFFDAFLAHIFLGVPRMVSPSSPAVHPINNAH